MGCAQSRPAPPPTAELPTSGTHAGESAAAGTKSAAEPLETVRTAVVDNPVAAETVGVDTAAPALRPAPAAQQSPKRGPPNPETVGAIKSIFRRLLFGGSANGGGSPDAGQVYAEVEKLHAVLGIPFGHDGEGEGDGEGDGVSSSPRRRATLLRRLGEEGATSKEVLGYPLLSLLNSWTDTFTAVQHRWSHRALANVKVVVCGAGPVGLRAAVQIALMVSCRSHACCSPARVLHAYR